MGRRQRLRHKERFNYRLFAGQKLFSNTEEVLAVKSQTFDEAFLLRERKNNIVYHLLSHLIQNK